MMRTWPSGISRVVATPERAMYGTWVDDQTVTLSPCHWAIAACGSIGTAWDMSAT